MKIKSKQRIIGVIILMTILMICCIRKKDTENVREQVKVLSIQREEVRGMDNVDFVHLKLHKGKLYYDTIEEEQEYFARIFCCDLSENGKKKEIISFMIQEEQLLNFSVGKDGNIYLLTEKYESNSTKLFLKCVDINGKIEVLSCLNEYLPISNQNVGGWEIETTVENDIIVYASQAYCVFSKTGEKKVSKIFETPQDIKIVCLQGGNILIEKCENGSRKLILYSNNKVEDLKSLDDITESISFEIVGTKNNSCLLKNDDKLYCFNTDTKQLKEILTWSEQGISGDEISLIYENEQGDVGGFLVKLFEKKVTNILWNSDETTADYKEQLLLGCIGRDSNIDATVAKYNRENVNYKISIKDYLEQSENAEEAVNNMYNEILAGKGPDIIAVNTEEMDYIKFGKQGALMDLSLFLSESTKIKKEDFVEAVLRSCSYNEKNYILPTNFAIDTVIGKSETLGKERGWNMEQFIEIMNKLDFESVFPYVDRINFLDFYVSYGIGAGQEISSFFNKEEFIKALKISEQFPESVIYDGDLSIYASGRVMAETTVLYDMETYLCKKTLWNGDIVCKGYPGVEGNGSIILPMNCWGINERSNYKEQAWEFVEMQFSEEFQNEVVPNWYFSSLDEGFEKQLLNMQNGNIIDTYEIDGNVIDVEAATKQDVEMIKELVSGICVTQCNNSQVINIVNEEAESYYSGQKQAEEVADIVEKRMSIYVNE